MQTRITLDPNTQQPPDYTSVDFDISRNYLIANDANITLQQAADLLLSSWMATNKHEKAQWRQQIEADDREKEQQQKRAEDEERDRATAEAREAEEMAAEERKKYKLKHKKIEPRGIPNTPVLVPSAVATHRLKKGEWVPMWYYTPAGLRDSAGPVSNAEEESMVMLRQADGTTTFAPAIAAKEAKGLVEDKDLEWEDFCIAMPAMLEAFGIADWPLERIQMFGNFWANIQDHRLRRSGDLIDRTVLLWYQAKQQKQWHHCLDSPSGAYNLGKINEVVLADTKERVYWLERDRREAEALSVSLHYLRIAKGIFSDVFSPIFPSFSFMPFHPFMNYSFPHPSSRTPRHMSVSCAAPAADHCSMHAAPYIAHRILDPHRDISCLP